VAKGQRGGTNFVSGMQRLRVLAKVGLLEVHLGACQQAVVDFMFAAKADIHRPFENVDDTKDAIL